MSGKRYYLLVPYAEKEDAKKKHAKWCDQKKKWYIEGETDMTGFLKWLPVYQKPFLFIDILPKTAETKTIKPFLNKAEWGRLMHFFSERAGNKCEVCGWQNRDKQYPVRIQERWDFRQEKGKQIFLGAEALCEKCFLSTNIWYAQKLKKFDQAKKHMMYINKWDNEFFDFHYKESIKTWETRNEKEWKLDLSLLIEGFSTFLSRETRQKILHYT